MIELKVGNVTRVVTRLGGGGGQQSASSSSFMTLESTSIDGGGTQALGGGGGSYCAAGSYEYTATRMIYAKNGKTVTHVTGEHWCAVDNDSCPDASPPFVTTYAKEFRYDNTRQRYLDRDLNTQTLSRQYPTDIATWSDYDGNSVHGDYTDSSGTATNTASYAPGAAMVDPWAASGSTNTDYYHSDHVGTTRMMTDDSGAKIEDAVYTAFGERISGTSRRFGYAGAFGYQSDEEFPFQHLGARYYDPSSGRFLQRDPIGIRGGLNVYVYAFNNPVIGVDPSGLRPLGDLDVFDKWDQSIVEGPTDPLLTGIAFVLTGAAAAVSIGFVAVEASAAYSEAVVGATVRRMIREALKNKNSNGGDDDDDDPNDDDPDEDALDPPAKNILFPKPPKRKAAGGACGCFPSSGLIMAR